MTPQLAVSRFGKDTSARLSSATASGEPEDQLRGPFENLLQDLSALCGHGAGTVVTVGETALSDLKTRPDYAVTLRGALVGFVELNAAVVRLDGDVETSGTALAGGDKLLALVEVSLQWQPIAPRSAKALTEVTARLCRLLREEVIEALTRGSSLKPMPCSGKGSRRARCSSPLCTTGTQALAR